MKSWNNIGPEGGKAVGEGMTKCPQLNTLTL